MEKKDAVIGKEAVYKVDGEKEQRGKIRSFNEQFASMQFYSEKNPRVVAMRNIYYEERKGSTINQYFAIRFIVLIGILTMISAGAFVFFNWF